MKYKYKDNYNREYNFLVRARFDSVNTAVDFQYDYEEFESEQERHALDWVYFFVKNKSELYKLFKLLTEKESVAYFELDQK